MMKLCQVIVHATLALGVITLAQAESSNANLQYNASRWDPIHFKPAIDSASNEQCLTCHQEIIDRKVLERSPAGLLPEDALAWYQTLDTYEGEQDTFHRRHLMSDYAKEVMDLRCNTCHQGNDPREETANSSANGDTALTQRKHVDPTLCLMCHGQYDAQIMGVPPGDWRETGNLFNFDCLTCHAAIRTHRHQVNFLKPQAIEDAAQSRKDVCFGCHGGRAWYDIPFPYPRHAWPSAGPEIPDWAKNRPTESTARFLATPN
ncbi:MAG: hypothetical protein KDH88_17730 [Chromatiales bacterium]|nr:hypothetical protein [Chromatiales bacterium]